MGRYIGVSLPVSGQHPRKLPQNKQRPRKCTWERPVSNWMYDSCQCPTKCTSLRRQRPTEYTWQWSRQCPTIYMTVATVSNKICGSCRCVQQNIPQTVDGVIMWEQVIDDCHRPWQTRCKVLCQPTSLTDRTRRSWLRSATPPWNCSSGS